MAFRSRIRSDAPPASLLRCGQIRERGAGWRWDEQGGCYDAPRRRDACSKTEGETEREKGKRKEGMGEEKKATKENRRLIRYEWQSMPEEEVRTQLVVW